MIRIFNNIKKVLYRYRAVLFIVGLAGASIVGVMYLFNVTNQHNVDLLTRSSIRSAREAMADQESNTRNLLSATLESLLTNKEIAQRFADRDREGLYRMVKPLFDHIRQQNSITHWYFIYPDKTCFLRVHVPNKHDDLITRVTLDNCVLTDQISYGKELGKTALALRAVHPYYHEGQLIGYMELGVRMKDFFKLLRERTGSHFGLMVKKEYLDRGKWASVAATLEREDNWDAMEYYLLVNSTCNCITNKQNQKALAAIATVPDDGMVLETISEDDRQFVSGLFPFYDAADRKVGGVVVLKDIAPIYNAMQVQKNEVMTALLVFMGLITFFMLFFHKRAENELRKYRNRLEELVKERTAELATMNRWLNREIEEHRRDKEALECECRAREEAEQKQVDAVKHVERSARLASIGVMAAGITHEINQPLNAIKVTADSIQFWHKRNPGALPDMFIEQLGLISKSVHRIVDVVQHMRKFWVVPNAPKVKIVDMKEAITNALSLTGQQLHSHNIKEKLDLSDQPLTFEGNMVHLEQVIVNLVINAVRALDGYKQEQKTIHITAGRENKHLKLVIADNGPGLPTMDPSKLFDPFYSTHNGSSQEGMGLGLSIVKSYIDRYNGAIEARNPAGGGAEFTITFPFAESTDEAP